MSKKDIGVLYMTDKKRKVLNSLLNKEDKLKSLKYNEQQKALLVFKYAIRKNSMFTITEISEYLGVTYNTSYELVNNIHKLNFLICYKNKGSYGTHLFEINPNQKEEITKMVSPKVVIFIKEKLNQLGKLIWSQ